LEALALLVQPALPELPGLLAHVVCKVSVASLEVKVFRVLLALLVLREVVERLGLLVCVVLREILEFKEMLVPPEWLALLV
jgi:hypothetical protein